MRFFEEISRLRNKQPALVVVASGFVGVSRLKTSKPREKRRTIGLGKRSCELTEIVPIRSAQLTLIAPSDEFQEKMRSTISAIAVRFVATCEKRLLSQ